MSRRRHRQTLTAGEIEIALPLSKYTCVFLQTPYVAFCPIRKGFTIANYCSNVLFTCKQYFLLTPLTLLLMFSNLISVSGSWVPSLDGKMNLAVLRNTLAQLFLPIPPPICRISHFSHYTGAILTQHGRVSSLPMDPLHCLHAC